MSKTDDAAWTPDAPEKAEGAPAPGGFPALVFDPAPYMEFLDDPELGEDQKVLLLGALWAVIADFINLGFRIHPVQQAIAERANCALASDSPGMVGCKDHFRKNSKNGRAVADGKRRKGDS